MDAVHVPPPPARDRLGGPVYIKIYFSSAWPGGNHRRTAPAAGPRRVHRSLQHPSAAPGPGSESARPAPGPPPAGTSIRVLRRDRLCGLIHEYARSHEVTQYSAPTPPPPPPHYSNRRLAGCQPPCQLRPIAVLILTCDPQSRRVPRRPASGAAASVILRRIRRSARR